MNTLAINEIHEGDCLLLASKIESGSVDLILTDLPYGTMNGKGTAFQNTFGDKYSWDMAIDPTKVYEIANRILRKNGKMVLFSQEPYTTRLINESIPNIPFSYRMIWEKDNFANPLGAKKAPVSYYEDVLVFSKLGGLENSGVNKYHPLKAVFNDALAKSGLSKRYFINEIGSSASHYFTDGIQFRVPTKQKFDVMQRFIDLGLSYEDVKRIDTLYKEEQTTKHYEKYPSVFNLWEGGKYKSNILRYKKDYNGFHPTQKPVLLLEDLIKTFSNEGDTVVDLTAGSGSTLVAAHNTNREFIGIELNPEYAGIARKRIREVKGLQE